MAFDSDYNEVKDRIREFFEKYPDGRLRQVSYEIREVAGKWFVIYTAAAHRTENDTNPAMGTAWEPVPGPTNFTRDSEMQNAETSAWGRAIVACGAADTRKGIATREDVQNRSITVSARARSAAAHMARKELLNRTSPYGWTAEKLIERYRSDYDSELLQVTDIELIKAFGEALLSEAAGVQATGQERDTPVHDEGPPPQPEVPSEPLITDRQLRMLHTLLSADHLTTHEQRTGWCSDMIGRQIASTKDLTKAEASRLIDNLDPKAAT